MLKKLNCVTETFNVQVRCDQPDPSFIDCYVHLANSKCALNENLLLYSSLSRINDPQAMKNEGELSNV